LLEKLIKNLCRGRIAYCEIRISKHRRAIVESNSVTYPFGNFIVFFYDAIVVKEKGIPSGFFISHEELCSKKLAVLSPRFDSSSRFLELLSMLR
jgi:hypothetical protein